MRLVEQWHAYFDVSRMMMSLIKLDQMKEMYYTESRASGQGYLYGHCTFALQCQDQAFLVHEFVASNGGTGSSTFGPQPAEAVHAMLQELERQKLGYKLLGTALKKVTKEIIVGDQRIFLEILPSTGANIFTGLASGGRSFVWNELNTDTGYLYKIGVTFSDNRSVE